MLLKFFSLSLLLMVMVAQPKTRAETINSGGIIVSDSSQGNEIIYVNSSQGNDQQGKGTQDSPFQTITQALMLASPNTLIMLSPGTYSVESGETFPLVVNSDVTIEGHPASQGHTVVIVGGGVYVSPTAAGQNVTIVSTAEKGRLTGVTVTNLDARGYGLWIESGSLEVSNNTFTRNGASGISVNGDSNPIITKNLFFHNRGNGLVIYGTSQPEVVDNTFEKTGFGVSVMEDANPRLENNQIIGNRFGIILEGNARATLRRNVIEQSTEHGLVAIANSAPNLGTSEDPGQNLFRDNRGLDIRNLTNNTIMAVGTELSGNFEGAVDFDNSVVADSGDGPIYIPVPPPETPLPTRAEPSYRVIVRVSGLQEEQVKRIYPDAFATDYSGQRVLQVGLFSSWENARQVLEDLKKLGLHEIIMLID